MKKIMLSLFALLFFALQGHSQTTYNFTGNGLWTVAANWGNASIPPTVLPAGDTIFISPAAGGSCVLTIAQTIAPGASLVISTGASFIIVGGLIINNNPTVSPPDSVFVEYKMEWEQLGFDYESTFMTILYDSLNRVTTLGASVTQVKPQYAADGHLTHIMSQCPESLSGSTHTKRNSVIMKYAGGRVATTQYTYESTLPEISSYYTDTTRTDNNTGYYDSLKYDNAGRISAIYRKMGFGIHAGTYTTFTIKYPTLTDSTFVLEEIDTAGVMKTRISGTVNSLENPYKNNLPLYFHNQGYLTYPLIIPDPLRRSQYPVESLLPLLPNAIQTFKIEQPSQNALQQGYYYYETTTLPNGEIRVRMTNPSNSAYNNNRVNFYYKKVPRR